VRLYANKRKYNKKNNINNITLICFIFVIKILPRNNKKSAVYKFLEK